MLEVHLKEKPSDYNELVKSIDQSLREPGASDLHQNVIKRCLLYLRQRGNHHWFCDPLIAPIASHTLILFSFPNTSHTNLIKPGISQCLSECPKCVKGFADAKYALYSTFVVDRKIDAGKVEMVLKGITDWELTLIEDDMNRLRPFNEQVIQSSTEVYKKIKMAYVICMYNGDLARLSRFEVIINGLQEYFVNRQQECFEGITSGHMMFLMKGVIIGGLDSLSGRPDYLTIKEFSRWFRDLMIESVNPEEYKFWNACTRILQVTGADTFMEYYNCPKDFQVFKDKQGFPLDNKPMLSIVLNGLQSDYSEQYMCLLKFVGSFLKVSKQKTWHFLAPVPYKRALDMILGNRYLRNKICIETDAIDWMSLFCDSLTGISKISAAYRIGTYCLSTLQDHLQEVTETSDPLPGETDIDRGTERVRFYWHYLAKEMAHCFSMCLDVGELDITTKGVEVDLLSRRDVRGLVDDYAPIIKVYFVGRNASKEFPLVLVESALIFDFQLLSLNSATLQNTTLPKMFDTFPLLWSTLTQMLQVTEKHLSKCVFSILTKSTGVTNFIAKKKESDDKKLVDAMQAHNQSVTIITTKMNSILERFSILHPQILLEFLKEDGVVEGFWGGIFSHLLSQNILNVMYQTFDVEGRYEGILELMKKYLKRSLKGIIGSVKALTLLHAFEPCPKAVRVLMDIISALNKDIITLQGGEDCKEEIKELWKVCWEFLVMLYRNTLQWANYYHSNDLVEFTRDTLDLSHSLMDSYGILSNYINDSSASSKFAQQVLNVFDCMIVWLRLGDPSLLSSCVSLVFKGISTAEENKSVVRDETLMSLVKYAVKAKKYNNKLTQQQRTSLLSKIRELDAVLVDYTIADLGSKSGEASKESTPSTPTAPASTTATKYDPSTMKQQKITSFGTFSKAAAPVLVQDIKVPEQAKEAKLTGLDLIRHQLKTQRVVTHNNKSISAPAEARPAGFNPKKPVVVGRSLNTLKKNHSKSDSSDDDMEEDGVDTSDLFMGKKKPKVVEIDIHGRPLKKINGPKGIDRQQLEQQRMQMRLNVDLKGLYQKILKWNFQSVSYPSNDFVPSNKPKDTYDNVKDYSKSIEPLLMLECWAGIQSAKERGDERPFDVFLGTRLSCDGFFDLICTIKKSDIADRKLTETDLIILATAPEDNQGKVSSHFKSPSTMTCLGKIKQIKYYNPEASDVTIRVASSGPMLGLLSPKSALVGMKVMQMVTVEREYSSLKGLEYYDLSNSILMAEPAKPSDLSDSELAGAMKTYNVNKSQANAILGTQRATGFSLIQGPPGTGKTKTILGIVGYNLKQPVDPNAVVDTRTADKNAFKDDKILICAPSNAAVDELVLRLKDGVINSSGKLISPRVVRLGRSDAVNAAVKDCTLEELVDTQLTVNRTNDPQKTLALKQEHIKLTAERRRLFDAKTKQGISEEESRKIDLQIKDITKTRNQVSQQLDAEREKNTVAHRTKEIERRRIQEGILNNAQVICSTLSGSAHDFVASLSMTFNKVIIDEACQCVELSAIIPLRYGCHQCIMVGDPNQLPPTVLSQAATRLDYDQSLFVRMQKRNPNAVYLLDVQYRMHPSISKFPSKNFYGGRLKDGEGMIEKNSRLWHELGPLAPYKFFNVVSSHGQNELSKSLFNTAEANVILELVEKMMALIPEKQFRGSIGIISPYKEQIRTLRRTFVRKYGDIILSEIDFNTVDGFQGQEKDIIIMSCVRASENGGVGFLSDIRRMNVALTRAKSTLWILGNGSSLSRDGNWRRLIQDAKDRQSYMNASPGFLRKAIEDVAKVQKKVQFAETTDTSDSPSNSNVPSKPVPSTSNPVPSTSKFAPSTSSPVPSSLPSVPSVPSSVPSGPSGSLPSLPTGPCIPTDRSGPASTKSAKPITSNPEAHPNGPASGIVTKPTATPMKKSTDTEAKKIKSSVFRDPPPPPPPPPPPKSSATGSAIPIPVPSAKRPSVEESNPSKKPKFDQPKNPKGINPPKQPKYISGQSKRNPKYGYPANRPTNHPTTYPTNNPTNHPPNHSDSAAVKPNENSGASVIQPTRSGILPPMPRPNPFKKKSNIFIKRKRKP